MTVDEKIQSLRKEMQIKGLSAYIILSNDPHLSEYTPKRWQSRAWISGFDGSAGTVVVTKDKAGLWTDSRYFLQAENQLKGSCIELFKQGLPDVPSIENFLINELKSGDVVGIDGSTVSSYESDRITDFIEPFGLKTSLDNDLIEPVWKDRPAIPDDKIFLHPEEYTGQSAKERINSVLSALERKGANTTVITMLDELAWLFNIRGHDVAYNPVTIGFAVLSDKKSVLFTLPEKLTDEVVSYLKGNEISIMQYDQIDEYLLSMDETTRIFIDKNRLTEKIFRLIPDKCKKIYGTSVITQFKSKKNDTELSMLKDVMIRDGVALTRFFKFLEDSLNSGKTFTEYEIDEILRSYRAKDDKFYGDSFATICGYNGNGAIVHYRAKKESCKEIKNEGMLLLDSGGQYLDGTTDITRTISLGEPSDKQKTDYTLVMKGHIAIATAIYLEGTSGHQLDVLARKALWENGLHYGHGTGHGVGYFLNVHEGPQNIRFEANPTPLEIGMITSNEPGLYRSDEYGIRIENLVVTKNHNKTEFGRFLCFETLTLCYFDNKLIKKELMTDREIKWYNEYQEKVYQTLSPKLSEQERIWLREKTERI